MKKIDEILAFYEAIKEGNQLSDTEFSLEEYFAFKEEIESKNGEFVDFLRKKAFDSSFSFHWLQLVYNELLDIYFELLSDFENEHKVNVENQPLFRYEIEYNPMYLSHAFSVLAVKNGVGRLLNYLKHNFSNHINSDDSISIRGYSPPYMDKDNYVRFIYSKLVNPDAFKEEFYEVRDRQVLKIEEFLNQYGIDKYLALPIDNNKNNDSQTTEKNPELYLGYIENEISNPFEDFMQEMSLPRNNWEAEYFFPSELSEADHEMPSNKISTSYLSKRESRKLGLNGPPTLSFKDLPGKGSDEFLQALQDLHDHLAKRSLISLNWNDFKGIFLKESNKARTQWSGKPGKLYYLFKKPNLGEVIDSKPGIWDAVSYFFNKENISEMLPGSLNNNGYNKQDILLDTKIQDLIKALNQK